MRPTRTASVLVSIAIAAPASAWAEGIGPCQELYVEASFDEARRCLQAEIEGLSPDAPLAARDAYALLAATELADEHEGSARRAAGLALTIDPGFEPDDPLLRAPRVLALFRDVHAHRAAEVPPSAQPQREDQQQDPPAPRATRDAPALRLARGSPAPASPPIVPNQHPVDPGADEGGGSNTAVFILLGSASAMALLVTVLLATDQMKPVFRFSL